MYISDFQELYDLLVFYIECWEHELEYKEKIHSCLLFVLDGLYYFFNVYFKMHVTGCMSK